MEAVKAVGMWTLPCGESPRVLQEKPNIMGKRGFRDSI